MRASEKLTGLQLGQFCLQVSDMQRSIAFYTSVLGLRLLEHSGQLATLACDEQPLLILSARPGCNPAPVSGGIYHFAFLLASRPALAAKLKHFVEARTPLQGAANHLVSEALYLGDPDGIGLELYRDRPREDWLDPAGKLQMDTLALDVDGLLRAAEESSVALPPKTVTGHMHLHVPDLQEGVSFYSDVIGLDLMLEFGPWMRFLSADGYHHHVGLRPGRMRQEDEAGLLWYELLLAEAEAEALRGRLERQQAARQMPGAKRVYLDPGGHGLKITALT